MLLWIFMVLYATKIMLFDIVTSHIYLLNIIKMKRHWFMFGMHNGRGKHIFMLQMIQIKRDGSSILLSCLFLCMWPHLKERLFNVLVMCQLMHLKFQAFPAFSF